MKAKPVVILILVVSLYTGAKAFNPVMPDNLMDNVYSFRALSSAYMFQDYIDFAQNPLLLPKARKNAIFTGLSNLNASEFLFNNMGDNDVKFGGIYESGIGSEGLVFTLQNIKIAHPNPLGGTGATTLDSVIYEDTDSDGYPDLRRNKHLYSDAWHKNINVNFSLSFYLDRNDYGFGFFFAHTENTQKTCNGGDTLNPLGVFGYGEQVINNTTGNLISTVDGAGSGNESNNVNISLGAIGANFILGEKPVSALLIYRDESNDLGENYTAVITRDNAPLNPDVHIVEKVYQRAYSDNETRKRISLNAVTVDSELNVTYALNGGVILHSGKVGTLFDMNSVRHEDQLSDSIMVNINRNTGIVSLDQPEGTGFDGYFTFLKGLSLNNRGEMRFGISFYALKDKVKRHILRSDTVYNKFADGDTQPNDPDDFEDITYSKVEYDSTWEHTNFTVRIPCGFYITPKKHIELRFGALEQIIWDKSQSYIVHTGITPQTHEVFRGDGTHTITRSGLTYENSNNAVESITPLTTFFYGIGIDVLENLSVDIMNYATLTNLNNWQLSVVFKF